MAVCADAFNLNSLYSVTCARALLVWTESNRPSVFSMEYKDPTIITIINIVRQGFISWAPSNCMYTHRQWHLYVTFIKYSRTNTAFSKTVSIFIA